MDINKAAILLKVIEEFSLQVEHLRDQAEATNDEQYASECNQMASELLDQMATLVVDKIKD